METIEELTQEIATAFRGSIEDDTVTIDHGDSSALLIAQPHQPSEGPTVEYMTDMKSGTFPLPDILVCPLILTNEGDARHHNFSLSDTLYTSAIVFPNDPRLYKKFTESSPIAAEIKANNVLSTMLQVCAGCAIRALCNPSEYPVKSQELGIEGSRESLTPAIISQLPSDIPFFSP